MKELVTIKEAARRTGISRRTIERWKIPKTQGKISYQAIEERIIESSNRGRGRPIGSSKKRHMQTLLTTNFKDNVGRLEMSQAPEVGDEVLVLDGDKSAAWKVEGRRWCAPHWEDSVKWDQYLVLKVTLVDEKLEGLKKEEVLKAPQEHQRLNSPLDAIPADIKRMGEEWVRIPQPGKKLCGLSRSYLFLLSSQGAIRTACIRKEGLKRDVRLVHLPSIVSFIEKNSGTKDVV